MRRSRDGEAGFTLIELMIAMTLGLVILFAALQSFDLFTSTNKKTDDAAAAQDTARNASRTMIATLRQARVAAGQTTPLAANPTRNDLVVAAFVRSATDPNAGSVLGWVRYCTSATSGTTSLLVGVHGATTGDVYQAPGASSCVLGNTANGWTYSPLVAGRLQDPGKLFDFTSTTCQGATCLPYAADVMAVGVRVAVGTSATATTSLNSVVRDGVSFRNRPT